MVIVYPDCVVYAPLKVEDIDEICQKHLLKGKPVTSLTLADITPEEEQKIIEYQEANFHIKQERRVLKNSGIINPMNIKEYISRNGYFGLYKALKEMTPKK